MKKFPIALQLYSVRDDLAADFDGTLAAVKAMGYDGVEFAGLYGHSAAEVKALCEKHNLTPISAHVPYLEMMGDPDGVLAAYAQIGCRFVAIPYLNEDLRPGQPKFAEVIENAKMLGAVAKKHGMTLLYHNHDFEFQKIDGEYALDMLYREVPADRLETELDTCWVNVGGEDPVKYVRKYAGRAPVLHLKDFAGQKGGKMYALIGIDDGAQSEAAAGAFEFRPVGKGLQNFPAILAAAEESGVEWVVVEQDSPSMGLRPLECAKCSIDYLKSL